MHCRNAAQFRIDLRNKRAELQLFGELSGVEISNRARLNVADVDLGIVERFLSGFSDQMPDGFAFFLQIALKIGAPAAKNVNWLAHAINLANLQSATNGGTPSGASDFKDGTEPVPPNTSTAKRVQTGNVVTNDQGVNVMRAFVSV